MENTQKLNDSDKQITPYDALQTKKLEFILDLMAYGYSKRSIVEHFMTEFQSQSSSAYHYYKMAEEEMAKEFAQSKSYHVNKTINSLERLKKRAVREGDTRSALAADKLKSDLLQLTGPTINEPGAINALNPGSSEQLDAESARALAEAIARTQATTDVSQHDVMGA